MDQQILLNETLQSVPDLYFRHATIVESGNADLLQMKTLNFEPKVDTDFNLVLDIEEQIVALNKISFYNKNSYRKERETAYLNHFELQQQEKSVPIQLTDMPTSLVYLDTLSSPLKTTMKTGAPPRPISRFE